MGNSASMPCIQACHHSNQLHWSLLILHCTVHTRQSTRQTCPTEDRRLSWPQLTNQQTQGCLLWTESEVNWQALGYKSSNILPIDNGHPHNCNGIHSIKSYKTMPSKNATINSVQNYSLFWLWITVWNKRRWRLNINVANLPQISLSSVIKSIRSKNKWQAKCFHRVNCANQQNETI